MLIDGNMAMTDVNLSRMIRVKLASVFNIT